LSFGGGGAYCSKSHTEGFGSFNGSITNFDDEITYATPLGPDWEIIVTAPLPLAGEEDIEYEAVKCTPEIGGPVAPSISSVPVRLPVGLAPSAVNSPEKMVTPDVAGLVAKPA